MNSCYRKSATVPHDGMTLIELVVGLAIAAALMAALATLMQTSLAASAVNAEQQDLQAQAQFAIRRIATAVQNTSATTLAPKADDTTSGAWLLPATYSLKAGTVAGTLALVETANGTYVLAEPVDRFSVTSPSVSTGQPLVVVELILKRGAASAVARTTARLRGGQ